MAIYVMKDGYLSIGGTDRSSLTRQVTLNIIDDAPDATVVEDDWRERFTGGISDWNVEVEFNQSHSDLDNQLWDGRLANFALIIGPKGATGGADDPTFSGNALLTNYVPVSAAAGEAALATATFQGNGTLTRTDTN